MKKLSFLHFCIFSFSLFLCSCGSVKNVAYLQNSNYVDLSDSEFLYDARIMPKDVLTITVNTVNPEAAAPFNLIVRPTLNSSSSSVGGGYGSLQTYLVSNDGTIDFPVLGNLQVGGLTKSQCEKMLHDKIKPYLNAAENPVVTVRMSNYKISVIGEVNRPGMYTVGNEKINILEALAQAGDLTIYGVRENVKLIRENDKGKKEIYTLNLNDAGIISSPYYYLQQNDIIYVEPNKVKARNSSVGQSTTLWLTSTSILISLTSLLYNILK
jgi:polysaccharide export outer membrane protein